MRPHHKYSVTALLLFLGALGAAGKLAANQDAFQTGLTFVSEEEYSVLPLSPKFRAFLPERFELPDFFPPPGHQGAQSSCVGWSVAYGARSFYDGVSRGIKPNRSTAFSPAYVYNQIKHSTSDCLGFSTIVNALRLLSNQGVARLTEFPYSEGSCFRLPTAQDKARAASYSIKGFSTIRRGDLEGIKGALTRGQPVIVGMMTPDRFQQLRGSSVFVDESSEAGYGHAMVIVGYDEKRGAFKLLNSWGESWGDRGYGWVAYATMRQRGREYYVMDVPSAPPRPVLAPPPVQATPAPPVIAPAPSPAFPPPPAVLPPMPTPAPLVQESQPRPTPDSVEQAIRQALSPLSCTKTQWSLNSAGAVSVRGFSGTPEMLPRIQRALERIEGVSRVDLQIQSAPWPQCEAFLTLSNAGVEEGSVRISMPGRSTRVVKAGEQIAFDIQLPQNPGFVHVHYLQANGSAVPLALGTPYTAGQVLKIGQTRERFYIRAPFGDEMLVVVTSPTRLEFASDGDDRAYLSALRQGLLNMPEGQRNLVRAATLPLKTLGP